MISHLVHIFFKRPDFCISGNKKRPSVCDGRLSFKKCLAKLFECHLQVVGDHLRAASFNVMTLHEMNQLAVFEQSNSR